MDLLAQKTHYARLNGKKKYSNFWQTTYTACLVNSSKSSRKLDLLNLWCLPIYLGFISCSKFFNRSEKEIKELLKKTPRRPDLTDLGRSAGSSAHYA
jgi:hypothetical protein